MEVLDANTALLSNFEVLTLLNSLRSKGEQGRNQSGSLATITYETVKYLENSPSSIQSQEDIAKFLKEIHKFNLTKEEKLMLLNLRPTTAVEINLDEERDANRYDNFQCCKEGRKFVHYLMSSADQIHVVFVKEFSDDFRTKCKTDSSVVLSPAHCVLVRIGPQKVAEKTLIWHVRRSHDPANLFHTLEIWAKTAVAAKDFLVHNGRHGILDELNDYDKQKTPEIPKSLEEYINHLAKTGETLFPWLKIRGVLRHKLEIVIANFKEVCPTENLPPCPNVEPFQFETMRDKILEQFDSFTCAPFTIQRLCELLCAPRKHYKRTDKFMRGIEKNLLVVSTVDPRQRKRSDSVSSSQTLVNGVVEVNVGSQPRPLVTFGAKSDQQRPASAASDTTSVSDADSGISDTEDEEKPSGKEPTTINKVAENDVEQSHGAAVGLEESKATLESPAVVESPVTAGDVMETETPEAAVTEASSSAPSSTPPSEEESGNKTIDVESVAPVVPATEESSKPLTTEEPICKSEMTNEGEAPVETPISDKKRPLEKEEDGGEGADDGDHSPDAKQPRIFSPDKVVEEEAKTEVKESESQGNEELPVAATATPLEPVEKTIEAEVPAE
uniref:EOG090X0BWU n=1 Tax=Scapholeberis mucronata TaxID=202097 RepID=A0A4Y7NKQ0_9CRUS|nr:EOG090X0BWU [Scapholeberis mucronata]SVE93838.1 EOG090X0BWU [Scapholeberis mucronata]